MNRYLRNIFNCPYCLDEKNHLTVNSDSWIRTVPSIRLAKALSANKLLYLDRSTTPSEIFVFNRGIGSQRPSRHIGSCWADCEVRHKVGEADGGLNVSLNYDHPWLKLAASREDIMGSLWESPEPLVHSKCSCSFMRFKKRFSIGGFDRELTIVGNFYAAKNPMRFFKEIERKMSRI